MHPHQALTAPLLRHLGSEEALLRAALANATELFAALRTGDLPAAQAAAARHDALGSALQLAAPDRAAAATALARAVGLSGTELTLSALAAKLPEPQAAELLTARDRLAAVTAELAGIQARNANLLNHLRSFFRGVLSDLTGPVAPLRYGPSGSRLEPVAGAATQARG